MNQTITTIALWLLTTALLNLVAHRSQVDAWCLRRPKLAAALKVLRGIGLDPWLLIQGISLALRGRLPEGLRPEAVEVPVTVDAPAEPSTLRSTTLLSLVLLAALSPLLSGCAGTFEEARLAGAPSAGAQVATVDVGYCRQLDSSRTTWGAVAKGSAALAGASGIATIPTDSDRGRVALASATLAAGAVSVVAVYVSEAKGAAWVRDCGQVMR